MACSVKHKTPGIGIARAATVASGMAQRRKRDVLDPLMNLVALGVLAVAFIPGGKAILLSIGYFTAGLILLGLAVLIGVVWIRRSAPRSYATPLAPANSGLSDNLTKLKTIVPRAVAPSHLISSKPARALSQSRSDTLRQLHSIDWYQFEKLVEAVYRKLGYKVQRRGGAKPDGGIDLLIQKGEETKAVQCKHWKAWNVGVKQVREFLGALTDAKIEKGIFITLNGYSEDAKRLAEKHGIEIINETGLSRMLGGPDERFDQEIVALLNDRRKFCPKCEREMVRRTTKNGKNIGQQFWGCSAFPKCHGKLPLA